jgi:hypothetical protein
MIPGRNLLGRETEVGELSPAVVLHEHVGAAQDLPALGGIVFLGEVHPRRPEARGGVDPADVVLELRPRQMKDFRPLLRERAAHDLPGDHVRERRHTDSGERAVGDEGLGHLGLAVADLHDLDHGRAGEQPALLVRQPFRGSAADRTDHSAVGGGVFQLLRVPLRDRLSHAPLVQ